MDELINKMTRLDEEDRVGTQRRKVCILSTTPLIVHFFLRNHILKLTEFVDVTLVTNFQSDRFTPALDLPARMVDMDIRRKVAPIADLLALFKLFVFFRREKFDMVWAVSPKGGLLGMLAACLSGVNIRLFIFQGEVWASKSGFWRWLLKIMDRITAICSTHLLAVSGSERDYLVRQGVVQNHSIRVLGSGSIAGVDLIRYCPYSTLRDEVRGALGVPPDAVVVLYLGRLGRDKGVLDLGRAFAHAASTSKSLWLLMVGPDEEVLSNTIRAHVGEYSGRLVMKGFTDKPENFMAAADIFCLPSYREGFPVSILEAAGTGLPSIGSNIYGVSDAIVDGETGMLVDVGNVVQLSQKIVFLATNVDARLALGRSARCRVEREFEASSVISRYVEFIRGCLQGTSKDSMSNAAG